MIYAHGHWSVAIIAHRRCIEYNYNSVAPLSVLIIGLFVTTMGKWTCIGGPKGENNSTKENIVIILNMYFAFGYLLNNLVACNSWLKF